MKQVLISAAILLAVLPAAADARGCIKGAIVGGLAGHMAGHGAAGCVIGHHEANKADTDKMNSIRANSASKDDGKI